MSAVAILNVILLLISRKMLQRKLPQMSAAVETIRNWQFYLASIYTIGCGFRSILPRGDVRRIVLVDHWISAIAIGRTVATVAELAFVAQWAYILKEIGIGAGNKNAIWASKVIVPLIFVAECFSWYACTTTNFFGTMVEESLWAVAATITLAAFVTSRPRYSGPQKNFLSAGIICAFGYVIYMITVDIPAYATRWIEDQATGKTYSTLKDGFIEVATVWKQTYAQADWQYEFIWMSLYFSVAVWISIYIMNGPEMDKNVNPKLN